MLQLEIESRMARLATSTAELLLGLRLHFGSRWGISRRDDETWKRVLLEALEFNIRGSTN